MNANRQRTVALQLFEYLKSPSVQHMRDPNSVHKLAGEIVNALDGISAVWQKWTPDREEVVRAAAHCWIPPQDLRAFLNGLPGPSLTKTDVEQRLRAIWEEPHTVYPNEELKRSCTDLYTAEMSQGTELRAIIGALQEHIELEEQRLRLEREANWRRIKAEEKIKAERRFQSGADSGWTAVDGSSALYSRRNGRSFRIAQGKDKRWTLYRIKSVDDKGEMLGVYQTRRDANKALEKIAYVPEL